MPAKDMKELIQRNLALARAHWEQASARRMRDEDLADKAGVGKGTVGRISRKEAAPAIDTVDQIAAVFKLEAWELLVPSFDPEHPPRQKLAHLEKEVQVLRRQLDAVRAVIQNPHVPE